MVLDTYVWQFWNKQVCTISSCKVRSYRVSTVLAMSSNTMLYLRLINIVPWALLVWVCILQICWLSSCRQKRRTSSVSFTGCFDTFIFRSLLYTWVPMAIARFTTEFETTNQFRSRSYYSSISSLLWLEVWIHTTTTRRRSDVPPRKGILFIPLPKHVLHTEVRLEFAPPAPYLACMR